MRMSSDTHIDHQDLLAAQGAWPGEEDGFSAMDHEEYQQMLDEAERAYWEMRAAYYEEREKEF